MGRSKEEQAYLDHMAQGLAAWVAFPRGGRALVVGAAPGMAELLRMRGMETAEAASAAVMAGDVAGPFDVVLMVAEPERVREPVALLAACRALLDPHGRLLFGMNNRLGLRYFCGDADLYTNRSLDGLDDYRQVYKSPADAFYGRMYTRAEMRRMLAKAGFPAQKFYSVLTDLAHPMMLLAEGVPLREELLCRLFQTYHRPEHLFLLEERFYDTIRDEGLLHAVANAYFVECPLDGVTSDALHVTSSLDRRPADALLTVVRGDAGGRADRVEKRAMYPEGVARLRELLEHHRDLRAHGLEIVPDRMEDEVYTMPFIDAPTAVSWFDSVAEKGDRTTFFAALDRFHDAILASSEHVSEGDGDGHGVVLARGYFDLVPINAFAVDGGFLFFDQEFVLEPCSADVMMLRTVEFLGDILAKTKIATMDELYTRYGLKAHVGELHKIIDAFLHELRQVEEMAQLRAPNDRNVDVIEANRLAVAYPKERYRRLFEDIFDGLDKKQLVIFGSGRYASRFFETYGGRYPAAHIVDNNPARQGQKLRGITIESPDILKDLEGPFKVLICIKGFYSIAQQLERMGVTDYACFNPSSKYPGAKTLVHAESDAEAAEKKPYHVGYVAGVFDLFHQGHLNVVRRAKAQCDILVVGVVSDEGVLRIKHTKPFIPEGERLEILRACRYVDQAELLPLEFAGIVDAWQMFHFDAMFTGDDHATDSGWLWSRDWLREHGSDIVFFPYTKSTSSTKIKSLIEHKLL